MAKSKKNKPDSTRVADATARLLADSYTLYLKISEKNAWMLRSHLE